VPISAREEQTGTAVDRNAEAPDPRYRRRLMGLTLGASAFVIMLLAPAPEALEPAAWRVAAVAVLMAIFWLTEAVPVPVTALLPLVAFPFLGVATIGATAAPYADQLIFLFLGGFLIAIAIERWNLHRRIALNVLVRTGAREDMQIAGFMIATAALSMWVSNTATTVMMLPVALSIIPRRDDGRIDATTAAYATALLLSVAYAANIGGFATIIGTPPNGQLVAFMRENHGVEIGFAQWMVMAMPMSLLMLVLCWLLLTRLLYKVGRKAHPGAQTTLREALSGLGAISVAEKRVAVVCAVTAALWVLREPITWLFPGNALTDPGIAMLGALSLFVIPSGRRKGECLMSWKHAERLPWGVLILFGGGLTLAAAVNGSGLAAAIGGALGVFGHWPPVVMVLLLVILMVFLTELTSNAATTATFLPVVSALALGVGQDPLFFAIPAVVAVSFAFMLPVATPPNAIVFASGHITIPQMVRAGLWLNLIGVVMIILIIYTLMQVVFF
jgi:solute carrier family 13 (sodium-dependent dicarboxylate transporter), member 2/3/5